jgi:hypothetical protein
MHKHGEKNKNKLNVIIVLIYRHHCKGNLVLKPLKVWFGTPEFLQTHRIPLSGIMEQRGVIGG